MEPGAARGNRIQVRLTDAERAEVDAAVARAGLDISDWLRDAILGAARRDVSPKKPAKRPL